MESPDYFLRFPHFQRKPALPSNDEFNRLARQMKWKRGSKKYKHERSDFLASEFNIHYGSDATKLENWQRLCIELDIGQAIGSITKCRKALAKVHVNLVDLVDTRRTGESVEHFPNVSALRKYTKETKKVFPKSAAKADGFLKALLRVII
ncbi:hypothetical protein N7448_005402 [Penicillium atrosanguineum]|uniref:uncharacterized protein n=1 Tax=Penicillium atrosanguineum TaxID=1132637 RepID=UPI002399F233|nr:uncharacterized protein N7443_009132 [Penicillium atrosanguineum]KAJ5126092.1 hypothetical protein N7526_008269 [Penicillium atrosanguineum]KAJ5136848.1 hypothetical protein N7448_005402 [Penicillium atrosanguineum]KAJ5293179.1 hypothetical protein N7443_009132 [Penicillium atrosanguineum]